jgi:methyl-accepting chemotaxis protein
MDGIDTLEDFGEMYTTRRRSELATQIGNVAEAIAHAATAFDEIAMALNRIADTVEEVYRNAPSEGIQ